MTTATPLNRPAPTAVSDTPTPIKDTWTVMVRELRPVVRDPFSLIFSLMQPVVFLGLFGPLLVAQSGLPASQTLAWFVPGILVMIALMGTGVTGSNLLYEMQTGSHERTLVAPIARSSLLVGRSLKEMAPLVVQAAVIALVTIPFGFTLNVPGALIGLVMLSFFGVGLGSLSYALALASRNKDWMFWAVQQATLFPLMILSGMLLPLEGGPEWMQVAAAINPISYVVAAERALFAGDLASPDVGAGFLAVLVLLAIGLTVGVRTIQRAR